MPRLVFKRYTVPDLFPLYASQVFVFALRYSRSYRKRHDRGRYISDSRAVQSYLYFLFIYWVTLFEIIPKIAFRKRHDPGQITLSDSEDRGRHYYAGCPEGRPCLKMGSLSIFFFMVASNLHVNLFIKLCPLLAGMYCSDCLQKKRPNENPLLARIS